MPANILLSDDGRVVVTDFGIAKVIDDPDVTRTQQLLGTIRYLAPEQVEGGPIDGRTDLYALGCVLYEALCGDAPFRADTPAALALARLHREPLRPSARVPDVPVDLDTILLRALAREPVDRFATADDLRAALLATRLDRLVPADVTMDAERPTLDIDSKVADDAPSAPVASGGRGGSLLVFGAILVGAIVLAAALLLH